jgi:hypothetical protein
MSKPLYALLIISVSYIQQVKANTYCDKKIHLNYEIHHKLDRLITNYGEYNFNAVCNQIIEKYKEMKVNSSKQLQDEIKSLTYGLLDKIEQGVFQTMLTDYQLIRKYVLAFKKINNQEKLASLVKQYLNLLKHFNED